MWQVWYTDLTDETRINTASKSKIRVSSVKSVFCFFQMGNRCAKNTKYAK